METVSTNTFCVQVDNSRILIGKDKNSFDFLDTKDLYVSILFAFPVSQFKVSVHDDTVHVYGCRWHYVIMSLNNRIIVDNGQTSYWFYLK